MRKVGITAIICIFLLVSLQNAHASSIVKYAGQRVGASCKKSDLNKIVTLPNKSQLKCVNLAGKYFWNTLPKPNKGMNPTSSTPTSLHAWGETNFGKFRIVNSFSLGSIGLEEHFGKGTVFLIQACLQSWQPSNPVGFSFSFQSWSALDAAGRLLSPSTIVGPPELSPAYLDVYSDLILQPGDCFSGHIIFKSDSEISELRYQDRTFGYSLKFSTN